MVRAWYMDTLRADQRLLHMTNPPRFVSLEELKEKTGVLYRKIDVSDVENNTELMKIKSDRGYTHEDQVNITETMPEYEKKIKMFSEEHLHTDEEIRLILDGMGYFDVRDVGDAWIRIEVSKGDMIILPAGIYHRFALDTQNRITARRFFVGEPIWKPHNRDSETDVMKERMEYVQTMGVAQG